MLLIISARELSKLELIQHVCDKRIRQIDDTTSAIMHMYFCESESTLSYMTATRQYIDKHGKPVAFYTDKHGEFRVNHASNEDKNIFKQSQFELSTPYANRQNWFSIWFDKKHPAVRNMILRIQQRLPSRKNHSKQCTICASNTAQFYSFQCNEKNCLIHVHMTPQQRIHREGKQSRDKCA